MTRVTSNLYRMRKMRTKTIEVPGEMVMLYTATSNFQDYAVEVEEVYPDYENLMANSLVAIQFTSATPDCRSDGSDHHHGYQRNC